MKLPEVCHKIRKGQVWRKRTNDVLILIVAGARPRNGQAAYHCRRYDRKVMKAHAISSKDLWRMYDLIGHRYNIPEYIPYSELVAEKLL